MTYRSLKANALIAGSILFGILAAVRPAEASHYRVLYEFAGMPDGDAPICVLRDTQGTLFGTSIGGGTNGFGTVFKLTSDGAETVLYSFAKTPPFGNFAMDSSGNFYGATLALHDNGTIFKVSPNGTETVLHKFSKDGSDGAYPEGVAVDSRGNLFGSTQGGGGESDAGTVYKIAANGTFSTLHKFTGHDGLGPEGVTLDPAGNLYGMTFQGGASFDGALFKITSGGDFTVLHSFDGHHEGYSPDGQVAIDAQGNLFGTLTGGGDFGDGALFKYDTTGHFSILHEFHGSPNDAEYPWGNLVVEANGNIFGVTQKGGENQKGAVYKLTRRGKFSLLHSFFEGMPAACLVSDHAGHLFGATPDGGLNSGTLYRAQE